MDTNYSQTSTTLLDDVAAGDDPAAERRFDERYRRLATIVAQAAGVHRNNIEDVVQEAVIAAVQALRERRYDRQRGGFKKWFKGILFHKVYHARRDSARRSAGDAVIDSIPDPSPGPAEQVEAAFEAEWLKALHEDAEDEVRQRAEPANWQAYELVKKQSWKPAAVADLLGMRRDNVYNIVSRIESRILEAIRQRIQSDAD